MVSHHIFPGLSVLTSFIRIPADSPLGIPPAFKLGLVLSIIVHDLNLGIHEE